MSTAPRSPQSPAPRVVVAGGGVAALEAVLALRALAGDRVEIDLVCPDERFDYRPLAVLAPFGYEMPVRVDLAAFARDHGATLHVAGLSGVDIEGHAVTTSDGEVIRHDALLVAIGARPHEQVAGALTFRGAQDVEDLRRLLDAAVAREADRIAFAIPDPEQWLVPTYELAVLTREHLDRHGRRDAEVELLSAERRPLELLGDRTAETMEMLLASRRIAFWGHVRPVAATGAGIVLDTGEELPVDGVVAPPRLEGVRIDGLPADAAGFLDVDEHCRVVAAPGVYAAGDITAGFAKQGGLASRQADAAVDAILLDLGIADTAEPLHPLLVGVLLAGEELRRLEQLVTRDDGPVASWTPPTKIVARHLAPYLGTRDPDSFHPDPRTTGRRPAEIEVGPGIHPSDRYDRKALEHVVDVGYLLQTDPRGAIAFARQELGPLGRDDAEVARLRAALRSYLRSGLSVSAVIRDLGMESAEVTAAVERAEQLRGRRITEDLWELRVALEVAARQPVAA